MSVVSILGARPQYIKLAPLHRELQKLKIKHQLINTGQHYDHNLAGVFFEELRLPAPKVNLGVGSADAGTMTARILSGSTEALKKLKPELVVVYGDTNSTLGGALAAAQARIPIVHVEAGLRCHDLRVPEELNRVVTDRISDFLMAPTNEAVKNLGREGITAKIWQTGDLLYDVLKSSLPSSNKQREIVAGFGVDSGDYILITVHRADSVDNVQLLSQLVELLQLIKEPAIFPLHPRTAKRLRQHGMMTKLQKNEYLNICEPIPYTEILALTANARIVATDSGGLQREAYYLKTPCLLLRGVTEWVEIVRSKGSSIVGFDPKRFEDGLYHRRFSFENRGICRSGAARRIAKHIERVLSER